VQRLCGRARQLAVAVPKQAVVKKDREERG